uniref:Transmembrane protein 106 C-terminal domain-containing protein n=1 Tax=Oncorhynchus tshawytscha TaxID=74940 RepID=A0AAZ3SS04_ONCTS
MVMSPWKSKTSAHANLLIRRSCVDCIFNQQKKHTFTVLISSAVVQYDIKHTNILRCLCILHENACGMLKWPMQCSHSCCAGPSINTQLVHIMSPYRKLYVTVSVTLCLLVSSLVLFFLFPRSVILSPVAVKSVYVYFTPTTVQMNITNILNITNDNFFTVQAYNLTVQALFDKTVVGKADMKNVTTVKPLTDKTFAFEIPVTLVEEGLNNYCKKSTIKIHTLFVHLQMSMTVYYLAHFEQLSLDTFEYIDCGSNTTTPHLINPTP